MTKIWKCFKCVQDTFRFKDVQMHMTSKKNETAWHQKLDKTFAKPIVFEGTFTTLWTQACCFWMHNHLACKHLRYFWKSSKIGYILSVSFKNGHYSNLWSSYHSKGQGKEWQARTKDTPCRGWWQVRRESVSDIDDIDEQLKCKEIYLPSACWCINFDS